MKVPLLDLKPQFNQVKERLMPELIELIESQMFILGPKVEAMEKQLAEYTGANYTVGVSSGTDAILLSLMALDIGPGDEVITTPYTFFATAGCVARVGAKAVFVDIDPGTYNLDPAKIEAAITPHTKAIMPVHLFGQCADMFPILKIADKHNLFVIEDACQAIGAKYAGKQAGTFGTVGCFSFFPSKNLGCFGDGGFISTMSEDVAKKLKCLRTHGGEQQYIHRMVGMNARLDALQALVVSHKIPHLNAWSEGRRRNAQRYNQIFADNPNVTVPEQRETCHHIFNQYVIRTKRRDDLRKHLAEKEIGAAVYYPLSLHEQECFRSWGFKKGDFPISEQAAQETLALPIFPDLTTEAIDYVGQTINAFTGSAATRCA
jgi:dTDP-4-amino-4,6-dideoxygalactose transaminase